MLIKFRIGFCSARVYKTWYGNIFFEFWKTMRIWIFLDLIMFGFLSYALATSQHVYTSTTLTRNLYMKLGL